MPGLQALARSKAPRRPAIEAARPEVHLYFHGVTAEDVAAIVRQAGQVYGTLSEHLPGAGRARGRGGCPRCSGR
jgi:hypothetical protein